MNKKSVYKTCIVPECESTSVSAPEKLFISLPQDQKIRRQWQKAMRRSHYVSDKGSRYCCEDHFNVEKDIENYMYIRTMKSGKIKLRPGVIPHLFDCQKTRTTKHSLKKRKLIEKKEQQSAIETCFQERFLENPPQEIAASFEKINCGIQVNLKLPVRSKAIQCTILQPIKKRKFEYGYEATTIKRLTKSSSFEEFLPEPEEESISDFSLATSGSTFTSKSSLVEDHHSTKWNSKEFIEKREIYIIEKNPKLYLGIPSESIFIVDMISQKCNLPKLDIFLTLKKIKLNLSYRVLADDFSLSPSAVCGKIQKSIPLLAGNLKPFIQWKTLPEIKENLPIAFRHRYKNVQCIIDCFEISLQKPSNPVLQSLSWSQYKGSNTMKYLISCTPDGLISYVSNGFGGKTTDKMIVEKSEFLNLIEPGAQVMADRGFKHLEEQLAAKHAQLVRPPSVSSGQKSSKYEVKEAKRIASLRIHIERVISRVREFQILQPHAHIHSSLIKYLDLITEIVCGLINVQNYLIK